MHNQQDVIDACDRQQRQIGIDIHNCLTHQLSSTAILTELLNENLDSESNEKAVYIGEIDSRIHGVINHALGFTKMLNPAELYRSGLGPALDELARNITNLYDVSCRFKCDSLIQPLDITITQQIYRIAQEAVINAARHAAAKKITISLSDDSHKTRLTIQDDGTGLTERISPDKKGMGLRIMKYRAAMINAELDINPVQSGGTIVSCVLENQQLKQKEQIQNLSR